MGCLMIKEFPNDGLTELGEDEDEELTPQDKFIAEAMLNHTTRDLEYYQKLCLLQEAEDRLYCS